MAVRVEATSFLFSSFDPLILCPFVLNNLLAAVGYHFRKLAEAKCD